MLIRDPFDIAPRASRHTPAAWGLLAMSVALAAVSATALARSWAAAADAAAVAVAARNEVEAVARRQASQAAEAARPPSGDMRARLEIQRILNVSWTGLFEVLEGATKAVDGRVVVSALAPARLRPEGAELSITALAADTDQMLQYLQVMQANLRVKQVQLVSQEKATVGGAAVLRFQATLLLDRPSRNIGSPGARTAQALLGAGE